MSKARLLCWHVSPTPPEGLAELRGKIEKAGYSLEAKPLAGEEITVEWLASELTTQTRGLLFIDEKSNLVGRFADRLRSMPTAYRHLPIFYAFTQPAHVEALERMGAFAVTDFFPVSETSSTLRLRLAMREAEYADRVASARTTQEQSSQLAKLDTTLKQREEFLSVCAHDLRSPLALIQTCLSMVLKTDASKSVGATYFELLQRAHRQSGHALTLVKDLLDVTALDQGLKPQYQILKLDDLLSEFFRDYSLQAEQKNIGFHYDNAVKDWFVLADSERIRQLLQNLFTNALKFTESGKNIYLSVGPFQGRRKVDPKHSMVVIRLRDEGKGIPRAELQKIFDKFVQIKEQSREGGRGLGLSVAKQISTLHDGNIWVESEEGQGSTFSVLFPHTLHHAPKKSSSKTVVIAEPSEDRRAQIFGEVEKWGYKVQFVSDGIQAVLQSYHTQPAALVLTTELSKITMAEVARMFKSDLHLSQVPVFVATAQGAANPQLDGILSDAVLPVPFTQMQWDGVFASRASKKKKAA